MMRFFINLVYLAAATVATSSSSYLVPGPNGPYAVAFASASLTDSSRPDPYASTPQKRHVLVSAYLPVDDRATAAACPKHTLPYMPPAVAAHYGQAAAAMGLSNDTFAAFGMEFCDLARWECGKKPRASRFPLVLYDTGLGVARELYGARARSLASEGYVVVTVDHPYDADIVEFPDGTVVEAANVDWDSETEIVKALKVRGQDLSFVLSQLQNRPVRDALLAGYPSAIDFSRTVAVGHSLGGVASALLTTIRGTAPASIVRGAVNMDGGLHEPVLGAGMDRPMMQLGRAGHEATDATWDEFWPRLRGPAAELALANATHGTFTDVLTLVSQFTLPDAVERALKDGFGSIDPVDADRAITGALVAGLEFVFAGRTEPVEDIHERYPSLALKRSHL